jgi:hypothetical protein
MFHWLRTIFTRKPYRTAEPWETPPEIRKKLRCASAGIDPETVHEPQEKSVGLTPDRTAIPSSPATHQ